MSVALCNRNSISPIAEKKINKSKYCSVQTTIYFSFIIAPLLFSFSFFFPSPYYSVKANETTSGSTPGTHLQIITWIITWKCRFKAMNSN